MGYHMRGEHMRGEHMRGEHMRGEHMRGEHMRGEHMRGEHMRGEHMRGEHMRRWTYEGWTYEGWTHEILVCNKILKVWNSLYVWTTVYYYFISPTGDVSSLGLMINFLLLNATLFISSHGKLSFGINLELNMRSIVELHTHNTIS